MGHIAWTCPECGAKNGCEHLAPIRAPRAPRRSQTEVDKARQEKNEWKRRAQASAEQCYVLRQQLRCCKTALELIAAGPPSSAQRTAKEALAHV